MAESNGVRAQFESAAQGAREHSQPFTHWIADQVFPPEIARALADVPLTAPSLGGVSGAREIHNDTRTYLAGPMLEKFPVFAEVAALFQDARTAGLIQSRFGTDLSGTFVRLEYCLDADGFWLEPHTDLGVKYFTMLVYLSDDPRHRDLGTDMFHTDRSHAGRPPFVPNSALIFVPSGVTYHGFVKRSIEGVRRSLILNYVTDEWRAREQLADPATPVLP